MYMYIRYKCIWQQSRTLLHFQVNDLVMPQGCCFNSAPHLVCLLHVLHTAVYVMGAGCHVPASFCIPFSHVTG